MSTFGGVFLSVRASRVLCGAKHTEPAANDADIDDFLPVDGAKRLERTALGRALLYDAGERGMRCGVDEGSSVPTEADVEARFFVLNPSAVDGGPQGLGARHGG